jgi:hypothetical protein
MCSTCGAGVLKPAKMVSYGWLGKETAFFEGVFGKVW